MNSRAVLGDLVEGVAQALRRPEAMLFLPAATLAAFWFGGERLLVLVALGLPLLGILAGAFRQRPYAGSAAGGQDAVLQRPHLLQALEVALDNAAQGGLATACLVVQFDDADELLDRHGRAALAEVMARSSDRLADVLRRGDTLARLEGGGFGIVLAPARRLDLESMVQIAARLQASLTPPVALDATRIYVSASIGFCLAARAPGRGARALLDAAQTAADVALRSGPGAIRAYSPDMSGKQTERNSARAALEAALDNGEIRPWFQPQVSTDTGALTGFEALARWHHPERGLLPPSEFLKGIEDAGLSERLGEVILYHALTALTQWDKAGLRVPTVGVNFSAAELRNPRLAEKLKWELDRFDLTPDRLSVEILETVVAQTDNDVIVSNIAAVARMGCGIDLDDFGVGHASITNIRRFAVRRIKIDRSFVTRLDEDREQQRIVSAVLSLAERLGLETLAEGVETAGEHAMLAQLGCGHVQGYGIARPMPFDETGDWIARNRKDVSQVARIGTRAR
jgi:predicted signal transduction protein with EAL and GGDEF domain